MKSFFITLTSEQLPPYLPSVIDHWFFTDPVSGKGFTYPNTIDGDSFSGLSGYWSLLPDAFSSIYTVGNNYAFYLSGNTSFSIYLSTDVISSSTYWYIASGGTSLYRGYSVDGTYSSLLQAVWVGLEDKTPLVPQPALSYIELPTTYTSYVCGGYFFPWGYQVVDQSQYITINGNTGLKGDTTVVFVPSGISTVYHDALKIIYEPDNGDDSVVINRPILPQVDNSSFSGFLILDQFKSPIYTNVSFMYYASSQPVTYYPTIRVLYGDMTQLFYYFTVVVHPNSIYDVDGVHIVDISQTPNISGGVLSLMSIESRNTIVGNITIPSK